MKNFKILFIITGLSLIVFNLILFPFSDYFNDDGLRIVGEKDFAGIEDLKLTGIVYSTQEVQNKLQGYHGRGIVRINIIESNIYEYDPRDKQANYFCLIKDGKAEIYGWSWLGLKNGDTLQLDVKKRMITFTSENDKTIEIKDISIGPGSFFKFIKKKGYQEL